MKFMKKKFQLVWYKGKTFVRWFLSLEISRLLHQNVHWIKEVPNDKSVYKPAHHLSILLPLPFHLNKIRALVCFYWKLGLEEGWGQSSFMQSCVTIVLYVTSIDASQFFQLVFNRTEICSKLGKTGEWNIKRNCTVQAI